MHFVDCKCSAFCSALITGVVKTCTFVSSIEMGVPGLKWLQMVRKDSNQPRYFDTTHLRMTCHCPNQWKAALRRAPKFVKPFFSVQIRASRSRTLIQG